MAYPILRRTIFVFLRTFFGEIGGLENLPKTGPYIIASNHVGLIDYFFIASVVIIYTKRKIHFIAKKEKWRDLLGNYIVKKWWGCIVIDPNNKEQSLVEAIEILKKGEIVGIFPEGEASKGNELLKGRTGVAKLAIRSGMPVVSVGFLGPLGSKSFITTFKNIIHSYKKVSIKIGKPMIFHRQEINEHSLDEVTRGIMKNIASLCGKTYPY